MFMKLEYQGRFLPKNVKTAICAVSEYLAEGTEENYLFRNMHRMKLQPWQTQTNQLPKNFVKAELRVPHGNSCPSNMLNLITLKPVKTRKQN